MQLVHDRLIPAPFWVVLIIAGLTCNGGTWFDTACLVTSVRNFPNERGTVVGLLKACVGEAASTCHLTLASIYLQYLALVIKQRWQAHFHCPAIAIVADSSSSGDEVPMPSAPSKLRHTASIHKQVASVNIRPNAASVHTLFRILLHPWCLGCIQPADTLFLRPASSQTCP